MGRTSKAQGKEKKIKLKTFCVPNDTISRMETCKMGKIFISHISAEELIAIIYEKHPLFNNTQEKNGLIFEHWASL